MSLPLLCRRLVGAGDDGRITGARSCTDFTYESAAFDGAEATAAQSNLEVNRSGERRSAGVGPLLDSSPVPEPDHRSGRLPDDYTIAELQAIATKGLAQGDEYSRELLRDKLIGEEFAEAPLDET